MAHSDAAAPSWFVPFAFPEEGERLLALNAVGSRLAVSCEDADAVHVFDVASGRKVRRLGGFVRVFAVEFLADDALLATTAGGCFRCDLCRGGGRDALPAEGWLTRTTVSPDRRVVAVGRAGGLTLYDAATRERLRALGTNFTYDHWARSAAFSADGRLVAAELRNEADRQPPLVVVWEAATGRRQRVFDTEAWSLAFRGDGPSLAVGRDGRIDLYEADRGEEAAASVVVPGLPVALQFRDAGRSLALLTFGGAFAQVRSDTGEVARALPPPAGQIREAVPSPDWSAFAGATADGVFVWAGP